MRIQKIVASRGAIIVMMSWIRAHSYASLFALASLILLAVLIFVVGAQPIFPGDASSTVSNGTIFPTGYAVENTQSIPPTNISPPMTIASSSTAMPPSQQETSQSTPVSQPPFTSPPPTTTNPPDTSTGDSLLSQVYALIPSGITTLQATQTTKRTSEQQALYTYGNEAGLAILSFENAHADMAQDLKNWVDDRGNAAYKTSVISIANDMATAGASLVALTDVPTSASAANQNLAKSLQTAADNLKAMTAASSDSALVDAMKTYNASADEFTASYIALADLFTLHEVQFSQSDTGSAFTFPATSGL